ncbi:hypothetical protein X265_05095 [Bradyrhizobium guangdongense]|nr:hypothetical protein X265_05095 [Bradyrhizobium guangdongense]
MFGKSQMVRLALGQGLWTGAKVRPADLQLRQGFCEPLFGFCGIAGLETYLLLTLANERAQVFWDRSPELIDTGFWMLPRTRHEQRHLYHLSVPLVEG